MKLEKVKRKIADGYSDGEIANMSGMPIEEVAKLRAPAPAPTPAPVVKKEPAPAPVVKKEPAPAPKPVETPAEE
jgi:hypothetical protein